MYLPSSINDMLLGLPIEIADEPEALEMVKVEEDDPAIPMVEGESGMPHRRRTMESVVEEDEDDV